MRCRKCGSYIDDNLNICPICGNGFSQQEDIESIQSEIGSRVGDIMENGTVSMTGMNDGVEISDGHMDAVRPVDDIEKTVIFEEPDTVFTGAAQDARKAAEIRSALESDMSESSSFASHGEKIDETSFRIHHTTHINAQEIRAQEARRKEAERAGEEAARREAKRASQQARIQKNNRPARVSDIQLSDEEYDERDDMSGSGRRQKKQVNITLILGLIVAVLVIAFLAYMILSGKYLKVLGIEKKESTQTEVTISEDKITCSLLENGIYVLPMEFKLESSEGNMMYFTLDGTEPTTASWPYNGVVQLNDDFFWEEQRDLVLRVASFSDKMEKKADITIKFTAKHGLVAPPELSHAAGNYNTVQGITITAEKGTVIYYTYDGSTPTTDSPVYTGAINMLRGTNTLSAIAVKGDRVSAVASATYTLELTPKYTFEDAAAIVGAKLKADGYKVSDKAPKKPEPVVKPTTDPKEPTTTEPETTFDQTKTAVLINGGESINGQNKYIIVEAIIYSSVGDIVDTQFYGIDDQSGSIEHASVSGGGMNIGN